MGIIIQRTNAVGLVLVLLLLVFSNLEMSAQTQNRTKVKAQPKGQPKEQPKEQTKEQPKVSEQPQLSQDEQAIAIERLKSKPLNGFFGLSFTNAVPQNEYFDNFKRSGQGFSLYGGYHMDPLPFVFGLESDFLFFGSEERHDNYTYPDRNGNYHSYYDTTKTQNMVIPINVFARVMPTILRTISPYVEGFAGFTYMSLSTDYNSYDFTIRDNYTKNQSQSDFSWHYGVGAGIMIKLVDFIQIPNSISNLNLDVKLRYLYGGDSKYWKAKFNEQTLQMNPQEFQSKTDMLLLMFGVTFRF